MRYALIFLFCLTALTSSGQKLELEQLKSFIGQPVISAADSLTKYGWSVRPELSGTKDNQSYQTFSFGNHRSEKGKALAWFRMHADNGTVNQLYYQSPGIEQYNILLNEIKQNGTEKKDMQSIEDNQISTYYTTEEYVFQTIVGADSYTVMVMNNKQP